MRCIQCCDAQIDQDDCCFCDSNSVLCVKHLQVEAEQVALKNLKQSLISSHKVYHPAVAPTLVLLLLFFIIVVLSIWQAKSKKMLCWKQSYEKLGGISQAVSFYDKGENKIVLKKGSDTEDDSFDECDIVYSTCDGTIYRKLSFKHSTADKEGVHDQLYLAKL
ncbi:proprotein convertase subtilisin/kexin type 5-like [Spea bombifrons]|uniref:proprotein convertase subtilisin/kexin type 5-like n=1 Tax=Spea bombifrons TaxID=233779 RepID=UPI00234B2587|nr:proprotein convertase subtilisin/kexin type 5-like [Spea bombifrons]